MEQVFWLGPWDEQDRNEEEQRAQDFLCQLSLGFPDEDFACRSSQFRTASLEELLQIPGDLPVAISWDLDSFLTPAGTVDSRRAWDVHRLLRHFKDVRGFSLALSRMYFPDSRTFHEALGHALPVFWADSRVRDVIVDLDGKQANDRSARAREILDSGEDLPRVGPKELASYPGIVVTGQSYVSLGIFRASAGYGRDGAENPSPGAALRGPGREPVEECPLVAVLDPSEGPEELKNQLKTLMREGVVALVPGRLPAPPGDLISSAHHAGIGVAGAWRSEDPDRGEIRLLQNGRRIALLAASLQVDAEQDRPAGQDAFSLCPAVFEGDLSCAAEAFLSKVAAAAATTDLSVVVVQQTRPMPESLELERRRWLERLVRLGVDLVVFAGQPGPASMNSEVRTVNLDVSDRAATEPERSGTSFRIWASWPEQGAGPSMEIREYPSPVPQTANPKIKRCRRVRHSD